MRSIKHLPRAVHSSLRSSVVLFDFTRVVEELIFNSLDAGATKVYVSINIGACYVKVEDDGCGISRDGLVLLGEKYATSKLQFLDEMDAGIESLGFRGVALGSLSDVSLLEIITKARGRSNGYRKIIKGCKCLFLGIDDHRQDVGTTVIVRDLFYNQPVRRRCMQSSPKKVLHLVKKCVLRTALVCPQVSFKVIDVENENELLCTIPSLSPLPLLTSWFGNEVSSSLHEVNFSEGVLKLSGYLSGHSDTFSTKTFQYVYINSRFVCKGPIHKMINNMAASSECSLALWKGESELQNRRRHKMQAYIAYMLNLCCPQSSYDLTFEPSKTIVEFKDWPPILSFIEQAVRHFWRRIPSHFLQEPHDRKNGVPAKGEMWKEDENPASLFQVTVCEFKDSLQPCLKPNLADNSRTCPRTSLEEKSYNTDNLTRMQGSKGFDKSQSIELYKTNALEEFLSSDLENSKVTLTKWRDGGPHPTDGDKSSNLAGHEDGILDISSGLLHLSGGSLQPESIHKDCLQSAKVLLQLDKKFIPVVAGGILAIIDQHAADERIRLEELRRKVLSGEGKTVVHLDSEQELILPEIGFQLLQTYAEQIRNWGWICNIHSQGLGSFSKNLNLLHRQPFIATLAAVPCILGINLSDKDLVEFLQQLAETDGSSTTPPAVLRILNFKACRGAIMFGDSLLPSECSLIVEELKETSLCFQCAHGRPTTVPIVNLEALHKQLAKLGLQNGGSTEQWHGLQRHRPTLERAKRRLSSACNQ
ncbi:DNA mismatch repair protein MLH3 isoform X10 [Magnolia sinica]|uniref:DNA mismatch repair protein MLH3 isoform X10 n=1 Tax=Magnolia sinica TaxID=86752 RepID=UPI00265ADDA3|nr:DNA mismatch repair protein MLH3 isoform X10 [Magnolia sinica]